MEKTKIQKITLDYMSTAEPKEHLDKWVIGYIPKHYKKNTVEYQKRLYYAKLGVSFALSYFNVKLFFTQSLLMGMILSGDYSTIRVITTSQYGKSFTLSLCAWAKAFQGGDVYVSGENMGDAQIIMDKIYKLAPQVSREIVNATTFETKRWRSRKEKLEKLNSSMSKTRIGMRTGGKIEAINVQKFIGRAGSLGIIDEADKIDSDILDESSRGELASLENQETKYTTIMISNPHTGGKFYKSMFKEPSKKEAIIWMDARTVIEEGRVSLERFKESTYFKTDRNCYRYLLCEYYDKMEGSIFPEFESYEELPKIIEYFMGVDSAYKGKDKIFCCITGLGTDGKLYVIETIEIEKREWIDGLTTAEISEEINAIAENYKVLAVYVDSAHGVWIVDWLSNHSNVPFIEAVNFASGSEKRVGMIENSPIAKSRNKRVQMHFEMADFMDSNHLLFEKELSMRLRETAKHIKQVYKENTSMVYITPKEEIKKIIGNSPDEFDSVLLSVSAGIDFLEAENTSEEGIFIGL